ncbi:MAG: hypothetical protein P8Y58_11410 [Novosphingobium sp.]
MFPNLASRCRSVRCAPSDCQRRFGPTGGIAEQTAPDWLAVDATFCDGGSWSVPLGEGDCNAIPERPLAASRPGQGR